MDKKCHIQMFLISVDNPSQHDLLQGARPGRRILSPLGNRSILAYSNVSNVCYGSLVLIPVLLSGRSVRGKWTFRYKMGLERERGKVARHGECTPWYVDIKAVRVAPCSV